MPPVPLLTPTLRAALPGLLLGACCVAPPREADWLRIGFRTPEQAIRTFQTAVRADSAELEYRCFSAGFRARNGMSQLTWGEVREHLREEHPWLRKGLTDARIVGEIEVAGDHARARLETHGYVIDVGLAREDFAELWSGGELLADDEEAVFEERTAVQSGQGGARWFYGIVRVPDGADPEGITDVRVGREWKIDSFESADAPREGASRP